jgi:hypothetical protein
MKLSSNCLRILACLPIIASLLAGCGGSGKREGSIGPDLTQTGIVQKGDPALAAAAGYVGSQRCSVCHPTQFTGWSKSLHNFPMKTAAEIGDAIFVNDANGNGQDDFKDALDFNDPSTDGILEANANGTALKNSRPNAPILKTVNGKHIVSIAGVEFEVQRVQGGNGYWKQRYHTKVGKSYYISPVQYNEVTKKYEAYNASHWYSGTNTPRFTQPYGSDALVAQFGALNIAGTQLGTARSFENRCAGCHQTGLVVASETQAYAGSAVTEAVTGYVELNIGCEACHGPGALHATFGNPADIINPANFALVGVSGIRVANMACGRCHSRGEGNLTLAGMSLNVEYPARLDGGANLLPLPGANLLDNSAGNPFVFLNTSTAYYGTFPSDFKANGTRDIFSAYRNWYSNYTFPIYVASRQHHQAWTDMEQGPHAPDKDFDITCWDCHDPHKAAGNPAAVVGDDHQIRDSVTRGAETFATKDSDNSLCLACHFDFFGLTAGDARTNPSAVRTAVLRHMGGEAVMGLVAYDPAGTGVGRCSTCHMPKTASSAIRTAVGDGLQEGDIHNHTFNIIWPGVNTIRDNAGNVKIDGTMVSSCYQSGACHNNKPGSAGFVSEIDEWSRSAHADFTSEPLRHFDADGSIPTSCARCHSKYGYIDYVADGIVNASAKLGSVISCAACHTDDGDGTTRYARRAAGDPLDNVIFPSGAGATLGNASNLCMICHQGRASKVQVDTAIANDPVDNSINNLTFVNIHYFAVAATLFGTEVKGGYEYGDNVYVGRLTHVPARDTCIECHMGRTPDLNDNNHTIFPKTEYCALCHPSVPVPDNTADAARFRSIRFPPVGGIDYNGNGNVTEGIYQEIWGTGVNGTDNVVNRLLLAIQAYAAAAPPAGRGIPIAYDPATNPYWFKDNNGNGIVDANEAVNANRYNVFDAKLLKAAYNYQVVQKEPCGYVHNPRYVLQLLFDSIRDLDPNAVNTPTALIRP